MSVPWLELSVTQLLTRLLQFVCSSLDMKNVLLHCWTDSTITLAWLSRAPAHWKTFVANRVAEIQNIAPKHVLASRINWWKSCRLRVARDISCRVCIKWPVVIRSILTHHILRNDQTSLRHQVRPWGMNKSIDTHDYSRKIMGLIATLYRDRNCCELPHIFSELFKTYDLGKKP